MACYMAARIQGGCDPSCSEIHPCGVLGCPSSPFIDPPAVIEPETGSLRPDVIEETSPLTTAADESHPPLEQPPSAPVLPDEATSPPPRPSALPPPPPMMAAPMPCQEQAINPPRQFVGESSAPPPPPQGLDNHEVPIQRVESIDYPPPGHRPFGGEDLGRRGTRRPFPGPHGRWYDYIPLISDLGRYRCRQYYPNDHYLNNRPWYRRVESWLGPDPGNCVPPRSRRVRDGVPASYCPYVEDSNNVPPLRRWNTYPAREAPSSSARRNEDLQGSQPAAGEGTLVRDNIVIGDPTRVRIGEGNRGGRSTGGRVTGNVVIR